MVEYILSGMIGALVYAIGKWLVHSDQRSPRILNHALIEEYCDILVTYGVHSPQSQTMRVSNYQNTEFIAFVDSIDRVKKGLTSHCEKIARATKQAAADERAKSPEQRRREEDERHAARLKHLGAIADYQLPVEREYERF